MEIELIRIPSSPPFPNNRLPLIRYTGVIEPLESDALWFERTFTANGWGRSWRNGVYTFHHFHSGAHEVLGCYRGGATVIFGGPDGIETTIQAGDAILVPAGVGHCLIDSMGDFHVVGAYPVGTSPDLLMGLLEEYEAAAANVAAVPIPAGDPIHGRAGAVGDHWRVC